MNVFWDTRLAIAHQHLSWPPHSPVLTKMDKRLWGITKGQVVMTVITKMTSYEELRNRLSPLLHHKYFGACHIEHEVYQDVWNVTMH